MPDLVEMFMNRFQGLDRAHGIYPNPVLQKDGKFIAEGIKTVQEPVTYDLWEQHLFGTGPGIGIVPINDDGEVLWGVIDIDIYNINHSALENKFKKRKLPLVMLRSKSGGAHLYLFLSSWCPASLIRSKLQEWATALGYPGVEIFPKQDKLASPQDTGNWINMPYYNYTSTDRYCLHDKKQLSIEDFLDFIDHREIPPETLDKIKIKKKKEMMGAPPCLENLYENGESKFRNNAMYNFGVYCAKKYGDSWEEEMEKMNQHCMQPPLASDELANVIKSLKRKQDKYFYKCQDQPICDICQKEVCLKRKYGVGGGKELNVALSNLRKIDMDPPIWYVDVNGRGVTLTETQQLMQPQAFAKVCVEAINIMPNVPKADIWRDIIKDLLDNVEIIEAPDDAGTTGMFLALFKKWIAESPPAATKDEILIDHPWYDDGRIYFRAGEMRKYISREMPKLAANMMWVLLRDNLDAKSKPMRLKGVVARVWSVEDFAQQDEDFETPNLPEM